ncbi:MAG TPA: hypothetical protein VNM36_16690 [Gemmatimonadaceae bacterium]|nr:hypothetical protein [Gemmatimonadaceae bacterium]
MRTAVEAAVSLDAVADDAALAVIAGGREHMDGAFEAIEHVAPAVAGADLE